jgi:predicted metal-dependent hydrolase
MDEPQLDAAEREQFERGVAEFNQGLFFECHDTLEDLWAGIRGPSRNFFQGLIQVSVAFYHLTGGNLAGAESMFGRALKRFEGYPDRYFGFDLGSQREQLRAWLARIRSGEAPETAAGDLPRWCFDDQAGCRGDQRPSG